VVIFDPGNTKFRFPETVWFRCIVEKLWKGKPIPPPQHNPLYRGLSLGVGYWTQKKNRSYKVHSTIRPGTCKNELGK